MKTFELNQGASLVASKSMMAQKRPSAIGSGIGGGLRKPTMLKAPTQPNQPSALNHGITGNKISNNPPKSRFGGLSP